MIRFTLRCAQDHRFESWFQSSHAFDTLHAKGQLSCPECGDGTIEKSLMAPRVQAKRKAPSESRGFVTEAPEHPRHAVLRALKKKIEASADYVGRDFTREARAIHHGDSPDRPIYGEARPDQARALIDDGIAIAPLPFLPQRKTN